MNENIFWLLEGTIKAGEFENFIAVMQAMVANTQAHEPGAIEYEWFTDADRKKCYIYERYADSAAVLNHVQRGGELFQRLVACIDIAGLQVFGNPNPAARQLLSSLGAVFMTPVGGFVR